ncbi:flagellar basal-body rod protein FlgF [Papillibacter cinnamivorans]|uniref:Flagellar basal-body rod protein FlgG n=1 Tax=Papillibacter cinnamivorans DSM 12816 TaxID=1122930 RepID=A0A1W1YIB7_9FIRM|nr:flagellar basal-body rod protein FlgF [Papillibacter cinnamivorans]SMC35498.1 flagellar basal-body rod protein FlgG [Papillibacter cinnamivorans DSM 12816]
MLRGLYTAATGMTVQRLKMDVLTNNIVNADTTGFKRDSLISSSFETVLLERLNDPGTVNAVSEVGPYSFGTHVDQVVTDLSQGSLESTGKSTDLAVSGDGYFAVETASGERYTRSGSFTVNAEGYLVTADGDYVLGNNGAIPVGSSDFSVDAAGTVTSGGKTIDTLRVVSFQRTEDLRKQGDSLYYSVSGETPSNSQDCTVMQGFRESSNVDIADEMVNMMSVYRAYEASAKILTMTDETLGLAVNDLGSLR